MKYGVEHLVDGAVHSKQRSFYPQIQDIVREFLGIEDEKPESKADHNEKDMDTAEQDMDVDDDSNSNAGLMEVQPKIETFIKSFHEVQDEQISKNEAGSSEVSFQSRISIQLKKPKEETPTKAVESTMDNIQEMSQESLDNSMPTDMDTDDSNEATNPTDLILEVKPFLGNQTEAEPILTIKEEALDSQVTLTTDKPDFEANRVTEEEKPKAVTPLPSVEPEQVMEETSKREVVEEPKTRVEQTKSSLTKKDVITKSAVKVKQLRKSTDSLKGKKERKSIEKPEPAAPLEEILSDVSSVHTSDLSDFDDRISISSEDEELLNEDKKRKISLQEVKKLADKKEKVKASASQTGVVSVEVTTSRRGRERKVNPKYASDDYSSIYSKNKRGSLVNTSMEEDIDSEEDFDFQEQVEKDDDTQEPERHEDTDSPDTVDVKVAEIHEVPIASPTASSECSSTTTTSLNVKQTKKKRRSGVQSQSYDASDLYKPRPVIGSSRRNRQPPTDT